MTYPPPHHGHYRPQQPVPHSPAPQHYPAPSPPGHYSPVPPQLVVAAAPATSGLAVASLIFGLIGFFGGFCFFGVPCVIAVLFGHFAIRETRNGQRGGHGLAVAGLILGYIFLIPAIAVIAMGGMGAVLGAVDPSVTPSP